MNTQYIILSHGRGDYVASVTGTGEILGAPAKDATRYTRAEAEEAVASLGSRDFSIEPARVISSTEDSADFESSAPINGRYDLNATSAEMADVTPSDVKDAIAAELLAAHGHSFAVQIFEANGHAIKEETPSAGSFIATRS